MKTSSNGSRRKAAPSFEECRDTLLTLLRSGSANGREDVRRYLLAHIDELAAAIGAKP